MNSNDLNRLLSFLTTREGAMITFSEEDVKYLKDESDIKVYIVETDDVSPNNRMLKIKEKFKQQTEFTADNFQHGLFLIETNPEHQLLIEELRDFHDEVFDKTLKWGLKQNPQIASVKITIVFSRKSIGCLKDLLNRYTFEDIVPYIQQLSSHIPVENVNEYYARLKSYEATPTDKSIRIASRFEGCYPRIDMNACMLNEQGVITSPIIGYDPLCELANMAIYIDDNIQISEKEVLAGLLLEIATSM